MAKAEESLPQLVVVHPVVLLSVVDHYNRIAKDTRKRVVGVLLGERFKGQIDVTNCYAVPFDEEITAKSKVWYFDHLYHENMFRMFRKVNAREVVVGWYSSGPELRPHDLEINELMKKYVSQPVYVIIDVKVRELVLPVSAYVEHTETMEDGTVTESSFAHIAAEVGALEAEEIGVEHLLRDVRDTRRTPLGARLSAALVSLTALGRHLDYIKKYLDDVIEGVMPVNNEINSLLQDVFNLLPSLSITSLSRAITTKTNDLYMVMFVSSVIRAVTSLHDLIANMVEYNERTAADAKAAVGDSDELKRIHDKEAHAGANGAKEEEAESKADDAAAEEGKGPDG